jgi:hypothetical protein
VGLEHDYLIAYQKKKIELQQLVHLNTSDNQNGDQAPIPDDF